MNRRGGRGVVPYGNVSSSNGARVSNGNYLGNGAGYTGRPSSQSSQSAMRTTSALILSVVGLILFLLNLSDNGTNTAIQPDMQRSSSSSETLSDQKKPLNDQNVHGARRRTRTDVTTHLDTETWNIIHPTNTKSFDLYKDDPLDTDPQRWISENTVSLESAQKKHRIAILIPYIAPQDGASTFPAFFEAFCATAGGSASLIDFLIIHDGIPQTWIPYEDIPPNVLLINLGSTMEMARLFLRVLDDPNDPDNSRSAQLSRDQLAILTKMVSTQLHRYPYLLVEFKPALGHVFQEYLDTSVYSHWGYSDLDILFGDMPRWITQDELNDFDIVTYGYGDQARLYIRGQFTFHRNDALHINQIWRQCHFLSMLDQRLENARTGKEKLSFQSAEGCYSSKVLQTPNIKVKYVPKAFTDVTNDLESVSDLSLLGDLHYTHGLYVGLGSKISTGSTRKVVVYRAASDNPEDAKELLMQPMNWFESNLVYSNPEIPLLHSPEGEPLTPIKTLFEQGWKEEDIHCMYWAPIDFQKHICVDPAEVSSHDTVFLIDGKLYKQQHKIESFFNGKIQTGPFFHFQEWKRFYRPNQLSTLKYSHVAGTKMDLAKGVSERVPMVEGWLLTKEGALPVYPPTHTGHLEDIDPIYSGEAVEHPKKMERAGSTHYHGLQGVVHGHIVNQWMESERVDRNHLPSSSHLYCLKASKRAFPPHPEVSHCDETVSWQDRSKVVILNDAPSWESLHNQGEQITLVLTLQLSSFEHFGDNSETDNALEGLLRLAEENILSWDNSSSGSRQPCILLIHVAGVTEQVVEKIHSRFGSRTLTLHGSTEGSSSLEGGEQGTRTLTPKYQSHHLSHCLVAAIFSRDESPVSFKALLNMAQEAAPTRWVVSGLELERGLIINKEASLFAHRAVKVQGDVPGKAFLIPQFASNRNIHAHHQQHEKGSQEHEATIATTVGIMDIVHMKHEHELPLTNKLSQVDCLPCIDVDGSGKEDEISEIEENILSRIEKLWWEMTAARIPSFSGKNRQEVREEVEWSQMMEDLSYELIDLLSHVNQDALEAFDVVPLVLVDRIGPKKRMLTLNVIKNVEEFGGTKCFAALYLAQLAALGYDIHVLPGAFAISLPIWRDMTIAGDMSCENRRKEHLSMTTNKDKDESLRCAKCFMLTEHIVNQIAQDERGRVAKSALLWREFEMMKKPQSTIADPKNPIVSSAQQQALFSHQVYLSHK